MATEEGGQERLPQRRPMTGNATQITSPSTVMVLSTPPLWTWIPALSTSTSYGAVQDDSTLLCGLPAGVAGRSNT